MSEDRQWELALAYLKRADESANYLRTLLFAAASGSIAFVVPEIKPKIDPCVLVGHLLAVLSFGAAVFFLVYSWHIQKLKAGKRFQLLRDEKYTEYLAYDDEIRSSFLRANHKVDWLGAGLIGFGVMVEVVVRLLIVSSS